MGNEKYEEVQMEIISLDEEDIITTSPPDMGEWT